MANAKTSRLFGAAAGALAGAAVALTPVMCAAQDATPAAMPLETVDTILCETDRTYYAHNNWTPETADLDCADEAATEYAESTPGVGVLIHVGTDSFGEGKRFATPDAFGQAVVHTFKSRFGTDAAYFLSQNDITATGLTYHVGDLIHGANDGTEVKNVREALDAMPEVAGLVRVVWEDKLAAVQELGGSDPSPGG